MHDKVIARSQTSPILQVHVCGLYDLYNFYQNIYLMSKRERENETKLCYKRERERERKTILITKLKEYETQF